MLSQRMRAQKLRHAETSETTTTSRTNSFPAFNLRSCEVLSTQTLDFNIECKHRKNGGNTTATVAAAATVDTLVEAPHTLDPPVVSRLRPSPSTVLPRFLTFVTAEWRIPSAVVLHKRGIHAARLWVAEEGAPSPRLSACASWRPSVSAVASLSFPSAMSSKYRGSGIGIVFAAGRVYLQRHVRAFKFVCSFEVCACY